MHRSLVRRALVAVALVVAAPVALASTAGASPAPATAKAPDPQTCIRVHVDSAELVRTVNGPAIQVKGLMPQSNMKLQLVAEDVAYVQQPDYWNYFVVGCADGIGLPVKTPFSQLFRVPTYPVGKIGIDVHGFLINLFADPSAG